jgi:uracil-DNA glycosylase
VETWLATEVKWVAPRAVVCLGGLAWNAVLRLGAGSLGWTVPRPRPRFGHLAEVEPANGPLVIGSYHPSQQNTFTGKLTEEMFDRVWARAARLVGST